MSDLTNWILAIHRWAVFQELDQTWECTCGATGRCVGVSANGASWVEHIGELIETAVRAEQVDAMHMWKEFSINAADRQTASRALLSIKDPDDLRTVAVHLFGTTVEGMNLLELRNALLTLGKPGGGRT